MIEVFKMIYGIGKINLDKVNLGKLFCINEDEKTRKDSLSLKIRRYINSNIALNLFIKSVINY